MGEKAPGLNIVGRRSERHRIEEALTQAATERGLVVLIGGETGVGKTALARHELGVAAARGFLTMEGGANPLAGELAYSPMVQALGVGLRNFEPSEMDRLVADLPALGALFVGLGIPAPEPLDDAGLERTRLYESVMRLLHRMSRRAPIAMLFDDLQWFDDASNELLAYLTRGLSGLPVLMMVTYRSEGRRPDGLRNLLQTLRRTGPAVEMTLRPLEAAGLARLATQILGDSVPGELVELLAAHSAGIPLYAEAMISAWKDEGLLYPTDGEWKLEPEAELSAPPLVREAVEERLRRLDGPERGLVERIAVAGGRIPHQILSKATQDFDYEGPLARLLEIGVVVETAEASLTYELAHPLMLQVAYEDTPGPRRRRLHARFTELWEEAVPGDLDGLAFHYRSALPEVDLARAIEVSVAAGRRALDRYANAEALTHLNGALELVGPAPNRSDILLLAAEAKFRLRKVHEAVSTWQEALAEVNDDPALTARIHLLIARALSEMVSTRQAERHVRLGLSAARGQDLGDLEVELLYRSLVNAHRDADVDRLDKVTDRLVAAANRVGTDRALALATAGRVAALLDHMAFDRAEELLAQGPALRPGGAEPEMRGILFEGSIAAARGDLAGLRRSNETAVQVVRRIGLPTVGARTRISMFVEAFYSGNWDRAEEIATEAPEAARDLHRSTQMFVAMLGVVLHAYRGEFDRAEKLISRHELRRLTSEIPAPYAAHIVVGAAVTAMEQNNPAAALAELDRVNAPWASSGFPPWGRVIRAEALARLGRSEHARASADELATLTGECTYLSAMAQRIEGLVRQASEPEAAIEHLERSRAAFDRLGMPFETARAGIEAAEVALRVGRTDDLADSIQAWLHTTVTLGAQRYAARARRLLHALGRPVSTNGSRDGLTARQREVAELVAQGLSNAEIAQALFISVRTVESHLDHIYTRLGIRSRVALASRVTETRPEART